eukprot:CAMPEP_0173457072 /NCGR_PEP_ID=MMETSP1357-20121228/57112_1 /TAXON_ID=77926 /ORGANISM="Hemiselmis rufescens, Strain PCC563" /LENGTH=42 /DNA_ID= /DNA_START= /DNA_END= /DNA_ORIENTATION=
MTAPCKSPAPSVAFWFALAYLCSWCSLVPFAKCFFGRKVFVF